MSTMNQFQRAQAVKNALPVFDAATMRGQPELAERFLGGTKYLIQREDEKRFKRLLPDREMPENVYGPDYTALVKSLGLDDIKTDEYSRRANFTVSTKQPISIGLDSQLYVAPSANLYGNQNVKIARGIITSQYGKKILPDD